MNFNTGFFHKENAPFIIAGPCSAESEIQLMNTAVSLAQTGKIDVFRAGIWKPRTKPGQFEGAGDIGLKWLSKVKQETGLSVATEIATAEHARKAMDAGLDVVWVGARTSGNPLYVQEMASALKNCNVKVLVKNPLHPDVDLWCGAIQRFYDAGIHDVAAVHRGFFPFEKTPFRNLPLWEIPIELKLRNKNIPLLCDPSHIAGKTEYIERISQQALDLNMTGLMIEVHENPKVALTDKSQQLTPEQFVGLLDGLEIRKEKFRDKSYKAKMEMLRKDIDEIDFQLLDLLTQRQKVVKEIAQCKSEMNVSVLQLQRWEKIVKTRLDYAKKNDLSGPFVLKLLQSIHKEAIRLQTEMIQNIKPFS